MAKKFSELHSDMKPESQLRSQAMTEQLLREMPLHQLRQARKLSQKLLAELLNEQQRSIAKLEKRADMYLSCLRTHIQAMGGELKLLLVFLMAQLRLIVFQISRIALSRINVNNDVVKKRLYKCLIR